MRETEGLSCCLEMDTSPVEFVQDLAVLLVESRVPEISKFGKHGGTHAWPLSKQSKKPCCESKLLSQKNRCDLVASTRSEVLHQFEAEGKLCVELFVDPSTLTDAAVTERISLDGIDISKCILLERWSASAVSISDAIQPASSGATVNLLLQAVRSSLHFSQLSSWWSVSGGLFPAKVVYRLCKSVSEFLCEPQLHEFPRGLISNTSCMKVSVNSLPRMEISKFTEIIMNKKNMHFDWRGSTSNKEPIIKKDTSDCLAGPSSRPNNYPLYQSSWVNFKLQQSPTNKSITLSKDKKANEDLAIVPDTASNTHHIQSKSDFSTFCRNKQTSHSDCLTWKQSVACKPRVICQNNENNGNAAQFHSAQDTNENTKIEESSHNSLCFDSNFNSQFGLYKPTTKMKPVNSALSSMIKEFQIDEKTSSDTGERHCHIQNDNPLPLLFSLPSTSSTSANPSSTESFGANCMYCLPQERQQCVHPTPPKRFKCQEDDSDDSQDVDESCSSLSSVTDDSSVTSSSCMTDEGSILSADNSLCGYPGAYSVGGYRVRSKSTSPNFPAHKKAVTGVPSGSLVPRRLAMISGTVPIFHPGTGLPISSSPAPIKKPSQTNDEQVSQSGSSSDSSVGLSKSAPTRLLGNFEESLLQGRIPLHGTLDGFKAELSASGAFCPKHIRLSVKVHFFQMSDENHPSPYLGYINLSKKLGKKGYHVPKKGTVQLTLFNPNQTVVKVFIVNYNYSDMPPASQTFLRQKVISIRKGDDTLDIPYLHYALHLRFISTRHNHVYLHTNIRVIFPQQTPDLEACRKLHTFTDGPTDPKYVAYGRNNRRACIDLTGEFVKEYERYMQGSN